ncbi:MAG: hypothetical protein COA88_11730 [Kordia sp.]|nr:MAG: hypothetical protein COA88_11730 [Kordia sp.]
MISTTLQFKTSIIHLMTLFLVCNIYSQTTLNNLHNDYKKATSTREKTTSLLNIARYHKDKNTDSTKYYINTALYLSKEAEYERGMYEATLLNAIVENYNGNHLLSNEIFNNSSKIAKKINNKYLEAKSYTIGAQLNSRKGYYKDAIRMSLKAEQNYLQLDSIPMLRIKNLNELAFLYIRFEHYQKALEYLIKCSKLYNNKIKNIKTPSKELLQKQAFTLSYLGIINSDLKNHDKANEYFKLSIQKFNYIKDNLGLYVTKHNSAIAHFNNKNIKEAEQIFNNSINPKNALQVRAEGHNYLGKIAMMVNNYDLALKHFNFSNKYKLHKEISPYYLKSQLETAKIYHKKKEYQKAINIADNVIKRSNEDDFSPYLRDSYLLLSSIYNSINQPSKQLHFFKKHIEVKDAIINKNNQFKISSLKLNFKFDKLNDQINNQKEAIQLLNEKNKIKSNNNILLSLLTIILITFLLITYFRHKRTSKLKKNKWLAENKIQELEKKQLELEVNSKNSQITDFAIHISEKNNLLKSIKKKIKALNSNSSEIKNLLLFINDDISKNNERVKLYADVKDANNSFYDKLSNNYPSLNQKEKKVAILIRLNHSSTQISMQMNIAKGSVNNYRYSLRKAFNLTTNQSLTKFIKEL